MKKKLLIFLLCLGSFFKVRTQTVTVAQQWATPHAVNSTNTQTTYDMTLDDSGNVYIVGLTDNGMGLNDGYVAKLSSTGVVLWDRTYGQAGWQDWFNTVSVDDSGNVYAAGLKNNSTGLQSTMIVKYNSSGQLQYTDTLTLRNAVDNISPYNGSILTLIWNYNVTIRKYQGNSLLWQITNDSTTMAYSILPKFIGLDTIGNIYVGGSKAISSDVRYFVKKFDSNGGFLWSSEYNPGPSIDDLEDMKIDKYGNAYLVGYINNSNGGFSIVKFNPTGGLAWAKVYNTNVVIANKSAIDVDKNGNVYISGRYSTSTASQCHVVKYDSAGNFQWYTPLDTIGAGANTDIALDVSGNVFVTSPKYPFTGSNYRTCRLSPVNGSIVWEIDYNGAANNTDYSVKVLPDTIGNVYVTGMEQKSSGGNYATTIKYSQSVGINELNISPNISIYPNPSSGIFTVNLTTNSEQLSTIQIHNTLGELISPLSLRRGVGGEVELDLRSKSPGIYFITVTTKENTYNAKIIIQ